jgi:hypothetical protein
LISVTSDPPTKSTYEDMFQLEIIVFQFCIDKILSSYLDLRILNEVFGQLELMISVFLESN